MLCRYSRRLSGGWPPVGSLCTLCHGLRFCVGDCACCELVVLARIPNRERRNCNLRNMLRLTRRCTRGKVVMVLDLNVVRLFIHLVGRCHVVILIVVRRRDDDGLGPSVGDAVDGSTGPACTA